MSCSRPLFSAKYPYLVYTPQTCLKPGVREGHVLGSEWAWNGHFTLTPLDRSLVLPFVLCCINTDALGPSRASKWLKPLHGDFLLHCLVSRNCFYCLSSELSHCHAGGPSRPILSLFSPGHHHHVFFSLLAHPLALSLILFISPSLS
jgi:hypothetical protein